MSNTRYCAQWGIHWEQWCWQWKAIMDLSDKFANCPSSSLTAHRSVEVVLYELLCEEESEWRTGFPEWCFLCCFEEGRVDSLYLSLINLSDEVEKCLYLINKRDTAYAFPQNLLSLARRCEQGQRCWWRTCCGGGNHPDWLAYLTGSVLSFRISLKVIEKGFSLFFHMDTCLYTWIKQLTRVYKLSPDVPFSLWHL